MTRQPPRPAKHEPRTRAHPKHPPQHDRPRATRSAEFRQTALIRPVSASLTLRDVTIFAEPVSKNRPGVRSRSTAAFDRQQQIRHTLDLVDEHRDFQSRDETFRIRERPLSRGSRVEAEVIGTGSLDASLRSLVQSCGCRCSTVAGAGAENVAEVARGSTEGGLGGGGNRQCLLACEQAQASGATVV